MSTVRPKEADQRGYDVDEDCVAAASACLTTTIISSIPVMASDGPTHFLSLKVMRVSVRKLS
jgi:hypothetical protein